MTDEEGIWISDEDNAILQEAKAGAEGAIQTEAPQAEGVEPVYLAGTVDAQLKDLRDAGDTANYENAREVAMQSALDRGDEAEFLRITEQHRPAHQPQYLVSAAPEPTAEEATKVQAILDSPAYRSEMEATDGDPEQMVKRLRQVQGARGSAPNHRTSTSGPSTSVWPGVEGKWLIPRPFWKREQRRPRPRP